MSKLDIIGPGYEGRSKNLNASTCINFFPEIETADSKSVSALIGTPGTEYWANANTDIRGMHAFNNLIYYVAGNKLYSIDVSKNISTQLGEDLNTSIGRVVFANNGVSPTGGDDLIFADGAKLYNYNITSTASTAFTSIDIAASTVCFIGTRFVADIGSGGRFRWSNVNDGSTWDELDFATAESSPDGLLSVFNNHGELWLHGDYTTEIFYQTSSGFTRVSGGVIDFGCAAKHSISQLNNTIIWLGNKRNNNQPGFAGVLMASGYNAQVISTPAINYQISQYSVIDDAFSYSYMEEGHEFYVLTFPTANKTWVYDTTVGLWHQRSTYSDDPYKINRHLSDSYVKFQGKHYVSDYRNANILEMSMDYLTDNGDPIASLRSGIHLFDPNSLENIFISKLQLDCEVGLSTDYYDITNAYNIYTTNDSSSTNVVMEINGLEVINTYLSEGDVIFSNPLPLIFMTCLNFGLNNWPTDGGYWECSGWTDRVTYNANNTITLQLPTHTATIIPHNAPITAVMDPANGVTNPSNLSFPQYPEINTYSDNPDYSFTVSLDGFYSDNVSTINYKISFDPKVVLSWSDNGGHTWSGGVEASLGKIGEYKKRVIWRRLGYSKNRVFRFLISDPIKKVINAQYIEAM